MTLGEKQRLFSRLLIGLLWKAHELGFEVTLGDAYRSPRVFGRVGERKGYGRPWSNHKSRLAIDLNLFREGVYLLRSEDHKPLGEWWERQHPLCSWGGRWGDGNHYSLEHNGRH